MVKDDKKLELISSMLEIIEKNNGDVFAELNQSSDYEDYERIIRKYCRGEIEDNDTKRLKELKTFVATWRVLRDIRFGIISTEEEVVKKLEDLKLLLK